MSKWFEKQRQSFILEQLEEFGSINRSDIMDKFDVGSATSTRDIKRYIQAHPEDLIYNVTEKCYENRNKQKEDKDECYDT